MSLGRVLLLSGPTGVGKTRLSLKLGSLFPSEIVSGDSAQVFKGMDIGTDKILPPARDQLPHHLLDLVDPLGSFTASDFYDLSKKAFQKIHGLGKIPMVVGGTGFYLRWLLYGKPNPASHDPIVTERIRKEIEQENNWDVSLKRLERVDPIYAAKLTRNDFYRLGRALVIVETTGSPVSSFGFKTEAPQAFDYRPIFLYSDRYELNLKLDRRAEEIIQKGLIEEVIRFRKQGLRTSHQAGKAIGYRVTLDLLDKLEQCSKSEEELDKLFFQYLLDYQTDMRNFAKYQWHWFRNEKPFRWMRADDPDIADQILRYLALSPQEKAQEDEEISRQQLDPTLQAIEKEKNKELLERLRRYRPLISIYQTREERLRKVNEILPLL